MLKYATWMKTKYAVAPGEIIAMDFTNSPTFVFIWLAIWSLGAKPAFINYNLTGNALLHCIKVSTARIVFVDEEVKHTFTSDVTQGLSSSSMREGKGPVEVVYVEPEEERQILEITAIREPDTSRSGVKGSDLAILIYTSGTTGLYVDNSIVIFMKKDELILHLFRPKAGIISWHKLYSGRHVLSTWMGWEQQDRFYTVSARFWICLREYSG